MAIVEVKVLFSSQRPLTPQSIPQIVVKQLKQIGAEVGIVAIAVEQEERDGTGRYVYKLSIGVEDERAKVRWEFTDTCQTFTLLPAVPLAQDQIRVNNRIVRSAICAAAAH
jgi:hypothetical protein